MALLPTGTSYTVSAVSTDKTTVITTLRRERIVVARDIDGNERIKQQAVRYSRTDVQLHNYNYGLSLRG